MSMTNRAHAIDPSVEAEQALEDFRSAHERRMQRVRQGSIVAEDEIEQERDAICRHARALRAQAKRA
jgi:hypothetical protein